MILKDAVERMRVDFSQRFGREPQWLGAAPGRVNLIGEHTDYNDGFVLPMAIDYYTICAAAPNNSRTANLHSVMAAQTASVDLSKPLSASPRGHWVNYPKGVLAGFAEMGWMPPGFDALIHSTVPAGAGLSSSAALEVAMATLLEAMLGRTLPPVDKALLCQRAEHEYAGVPCGIMDQFVSTLAREGHLLLLDCRSHEPSWVPMSDATVAVLIINTNVKHDLGSSEYPERRRQCEAAARELGVPSLREATEGMLEARAAAMDQITLRRARHVVGEIGRTLQAVECIKRREWVEVGNLMYASHASLKNDYAVSCVELDAVVDIARAIGPQGGVYGCRMTGGGFGGCAVALIQADKEQAIKSEIETQYRHRTGIAATSFVSRPARGASIITS
jgi:galactokinase